MKKLILALFILSIGLGSCNKKSKEITKAPTQGLEFRAGSFDSALAKAKEEGKPIFIDFYTTWCVPCKWFEQDVLSHRNVWEYYNDNIISLKVNAEKGEGPDLSAKYGIFKFPTIVYLDNDGNVLNRYEGMTSISNVVSMGEQAVEENKQLNL